MRALWIGAWWIAGSIGGCVLGPTDLEHRRCSAPSDCIEGYVCAAGQCVRAGDAAADASGSDAGWDASTDADASRVDVDAGTCSGRRLAVGGDYESLPNWGGFACAITSGRDQIVCWGASGPPPHGVGVDGGGADAGVIDGGPRPDDRLGRATSTLTYAEPAMPVTGLPAGARWASIAAGTDSACALTCDGELYCWGRNVEGQLGIGMHGTPGGMLPTRVGTSTATFDRVCVGATRACATAGRAVSCWGMDAIWGDLGVGSTSGVFDVPTPVLGIDDDYLALSCEYQTICVVRGLGSMQCWGNQSAGEVPPWAATGRPISASMPTTIGSALDTWTRVATGTTNVCGVRSDGGVACWGGATNAGGSYDGVLGPPRIDAGGADAGNGDYVALNGRDGGPGDITAIPVVAAGESLLDLAVARFFACALVDASAGQSMRCWGTYQLGRREDYPVEVRSSPSAPRMLELAASGNAICVLDAMGDVTCLGQSLRGTSSYETMPTVTARVP